MAGVELGLAVVGTVDLCLKYGEKLLKLIRDIRGASADFEEKMLQIETLWFKTEYQLQVMDSLGSAITDQHKRLQDRLFGQLVGKLSETLVKLDSVVKPGISESEPRIRSFKYGLFKEGLDNAITSLEQWHERYDPTWFLIIRINNNMVDHELLNTGKTLANGNKPESTVYMLRDSKSATPQKHISIRLDGQRFDCSQTKPLHYSETRSFDLVSSTKSSRFLVESVACSQYTSVHLARADCERLATQLSVVDPEACGILPCQGLTKSRNRVTRELELIHLFFKVPKNVFGEDEPVSLRHQLLSKSRPPSATRVVNIARSLAKAVNFVHVCDFVHKNIRPESIIMFPGMPASMRTLAFLLGFEGMRSVHYQTLRASDSSMVRNLYRHPSRQGPMAKESYVMQHDIYSLGVCLLEIGLWTSFCDYPDGWDNGASPTLSNSLGIDASSLDLKTWSYDVTWAVSNQLLSLAKNELPSRMGEMYTAVVVTCLTCLNQDNGDFGDEDDMKDEDGVLVGVRFIEKIIEKLNEICI